MGRAAFPELMDTGYASWDDVRYFRQECLLISGVIGSEVEFCIPIQK